MVRLISNKSLVFWCGALVALSASLGIVFVHLNDQMAWSQYFRNVKASIGECSYEVTAWNGSYDETLQNANPTQPIELPLRGNPNAPSVNVGSVLILKCLVDLTSHNKVSFSWVSLGRVFGESVVYWNNRQITNTMSGDRLEFPTPPESRGRADNVVFIIAQGDSTGAVGPWTLTPPYVTDSLTTENQIRRYHGSLYSEQPVFLIGLLLVTILFFIIIWLGRMRFWDIAWVSLFLGAAGVQSGTKYANLFLPTFSEDLSKISGCAFFIQIIALINYLFSLTRERSTGKNLATVSVLIIPIVVLVYLLVPPSVFFAWRMQVQLPLKVGGVSLLFLCCAMVYLFSRSHVVPRRKRIRNASILSGWIGAVFLTTSVFDERYGIQFIPSTQLLVIMTVFVSMTLELVNRFRSFYALKAEQFSQRFVYENASGTLSKHAFLRHDLLKPICKIEQFLQAKEGGAQQDQNSAIKELAYLKTIVQNIGIFGAGADSNRPFRDVIDEAYFVAAARRIDIRCTFKASVSPQDFRMSVGSERLLSRVFVNLFDNAFDAVSDDFSLTVVAEYDQSKDGLRISIENTGSTLAASVAKNLFTAGVSSKQSSNGNQGLGLAFCRSTIENQFNGVILCDSKPESVAFNIDLPNIRRGNSDFVEAAKRLAVVDDDSAVLMEWSWMHGDAVSVFQSPQDFLLWWSILTDDDRMRTVVVTDLIMNNNRTAGIELARTIKNGSKETRVLLSSNLRLPQDSMGIFDGVIAKEPVEMDQLTGK